MCTKWLKSQIIFFLLVIVTATSAQDSSDLYSFIYAYQTQQGEIELEIINPTLQNKTSTPIVVPIEKHWVLTNTVESVGNEWVALVFQTGVNQAIKLINLKTMENRDLILDFVLTPIPDVIMGASQELNWSPDGQFLVFNSYKTGKEPQIDTMIYSLQTNKFTALTQDLALQTRIAFSPDNHQVAVATVNCSKECVASIDLYDLASSKLTTSFNLTPSVFGANSISRAGICHLNWSPDSRYLSFMANCNSLEYGYYKEIYILDLSQGSINQVTNFTYSQDLATQNGFIFADYRTVWLNQDSLLISAIYGLGANRKSETLEYNQNTKQVNKLSNQFIEEWTVNPSETMIAFQSADTDPQDYQNLLQPNSVEIAPIDVLRVNTLSTNELTNANATNPRGCGIKWSPDGLMLAYVSPEGEMCGNGIQTFNFLNSQTFVTTSFIPSFGNKKPFIVMSIGWVKS